MVQSGAEASLACAPGVPTVEGMGGPWQIKYYVDENGREPFWRWVDDLPQAAGRVVVNEIRTRLAQLGPDICRDHWGRNLGGGLYELRIRRHQLLLRVFFGTAHGRVVVLLGGMNKGARPKRQDAAISVARSRLAAYRERTDEI